MSRLLTVPEAAERLGVSRAHLYRLLIAGELRGVNVGTRGSTHTLTRIPETELTRFVSRRARTTGPRTTDQDGLDRARHPSATP